MLEIKENQELNVTNLLSYRGKLKQTELENIGKEMESYIQSAGAILGGTGGLIVGAAKGIVTGNLTGNQLWKCYTAGAIGGATIGAYTPV